MYIFIFATYVRCRGLAKDIPEKIPSVAKVAVNLDQSIRFGTFCHRKHGSQCHKFRKKNLAKSVIHIEAQAVGTTRCVNVSKCIEWEK
jgi:hypothetical protein